jgi:MSHA biogenesis protein MshP
MSAMCPKRKKTADIFRLRSAGLIAQRGFSIVSAIFLLVVMASLGAFMVTFSTVQHTTAAQDIQGVRAYHAAHAGIEWGLYQVLQAGPACPSSPTTLPALGGTLSDFSVSVACSKSDYVEAGTPVSVYVVTSTATNGASVGSAQYIERELRVTVSR